MIFRSEFVLTQFVLMSELLHATAVLSRRFFLVPPFLYSVFRLSAGFAVADLIAW